MKWQKLNMIIIWLIFLNFIITLFSDALDNAFIPFFLLIGALVNDICFDLDSTPEHKNRAMLWIGLEIMLGLILSLHYQKTSLLLFLAILLITCLFGANHIFLIRKVSK